MTEVRIGYGDRDVAIQLPDEIQTTLVGASAVRSDRDPLGIVASALDEPVGMPPLVDIARGKRSVAIVVSDRARPASTHQTLLPILSRLARAGIEPRQMRIVVARGIHKAAARDEVTRLLGGEVMEVLRPVQSAPDTPELNDPIGEHPQLGTVRVHRQVATAELVVLAGRVAPHHLAGFSGGPYALVPGVAERDTVIAAHRLTLDTLVRPDGRVSPASGREEGSRFRRTLLDVARSFDRTFLVNVVVGDTGSVVAAAAGEVGEAHDAAIALWREAHVPPTPVPSDLVIVGGGAPQDDDLIQAQEALLAASAWAKPGAPIVWLARAPNGPGHPAFLPWFEAGKLPRHLAALRERFHPYGLTAYSIRRLAKQDHPVLAVSEVSPDILRPMGLMAFDDPAKAVAHALATHPDIETCAVLPHGA